MTCKNTVAQHVPSHWSYKTVYMRCGSTSTHGDTLLCEQCTHEAARQYPQGWRHTPGDLCRHGNYVGDAGGPDYLCGQCEGE